MNYKSQISYFWPFFPLINEIFMILLTKNDPKVRQSLLRSAVCIKSTNESIARRIKFQKIPLLQKS